MHGQIQLFGIKLQTSLYMILQETSGLTLLQPYLLPMLDTQMHVLAELNHA